MHRAPHTRGILRGLGVKKPRFKVNTFFQKIKILFLRKIKVLAIFDFFKFKA